MTISQFIAKLETLKTIHGDIDVMKEGVYDGTIVEADYPTVKYQRKRLTKERKTRVWQTHEPMIAQGDKIVVI